MENEKNTTEGKIQSYFFLYFAETPLLRSFACFYSASWKRPSITIIRFYRQKTILFVADESTSC
ncbi:Uncharacterised protein [Mycobacteroides abscessus subsp. abscessus]|nr:Uncharacterised protein [Mycobacteroides abscessus subsp. abscessus]